CSNCFLLAALRFGTTPSRRRISLSCMESSCPSQIDPAYMAIAAAIHQIGSFTGPISEQDEWRVGDLERHDRISNREVGNVCGGVGDDGRREAVRLALLLANAGNHMAGSGKIFDRLGLSGLLMVPEALFILPELLLEMGRRLVETGMGIGTPA